MIQTSIFGILIGNVAVTDIVSTRIYPMRLPRGAIVPAVVYNISDIIPLKSLDGESGFDIGTFEIICWAKDYTTAQLLVSAVRAAFVESNIDSTTISIQDTEDEETRNYGVVINMSAWFDSSANEWSVNMRQTAFTGDGVTTEFILPKFRANSLLVFFNGKLAKKGLSTDLTAAYWERSTLDGVIFRVAPKGGEYADEMLAFYAAG